MGGVGNPLLRMKGLFNLDENEDELSLLSAYSYPVNDVEIACRLSLSRATFKSAVNAVLYIGRPSLSISDL